MKKCIMLFFALMLLLPALAQVAQTESISSNEQKLQMLEQKYNQLQRSFRILETKLADSLRAFKAILNSDISNSRGAIHQLSETMQQHITLSEQKIQSIEQNDAVRLKRHNLHFTILYIITLILLLGIIFVYLYYSKFLKELEIFFQNQIQSAHQHFDQNLRETDEKLKVRVQAIETSTHARIQELNDTITKHNASHQAALEQVERTLSNKIDEIQKKIELINQTIQTIQQHLSSHENVHHDNLKQIESLQAKIDEINTHLNSQISALSQKINQMQKDK